MENKFSDGQSKASDAGYGSIKATGGADAGTGPGCWRGGGKGGRPLESAIAQH